MAIKKSAIGKAVKYEAKNLVLTEGMYEATFEKITPVWDPLTQELKGFFLETKEFENSYCNMSFENMDINDITDVNFYSGLWRQLNPSELEPSFAAVNSECVGKKFNFVAEPRQIQKVAPDGTKLFNADGSKKMEFVYDKFERQLFNWRF